MDEYQVIDLVNNTVFLTEDIRDKVNELSNKYNFVNSAEVGINVETDSDEVIKLMVNEYYRPDYVVGFTEIDDKFSKLIIRKVK
jgi:hypothetical protein|nr:MAG TPA_asm: hypothetical protein [Caudoviricetes sp.]